MQEGRSHLPSVEEVRLFSRLGQSCLHYGRGNHTHIPAHSLSLLTNTEIVTSC